MIPVQAIGMGMAVVAVDTVAVQSHLEKKDANLIHQMFVSEQRQCNSRDICQWHKFHEFALA